MDAASRGALILRYRSGIDAVREALAALGPGELDVCRERGGWTARQIVHHLADSEMTSALRLRRLVAEESPAIPGYDEALWSHRLFYDRPIEASLKAVEAARESTAEILDRLSDAQWRRAGTHSEIGPYSVETWLGIYAAHAHDHAAQILRAAGKGAEMEYADYRHLLVEVDNGVALVTLNRPEVLNATNNRMHFELTQIWGDLDRDPSVRAIVVTGAGDQAFSAGGDLGDIGARGALQPEDRFEALAALLKEAQALVYSMVNCDKIIVSAINGVAVGAGLAVALMADISIIAEDARLTDGHLRLGVAAGDHAAMVWPLLCGMAKAKYYLLTSDFIDGREAERIGLVGRAVPRAQVRSEAMAIARRLADGPQHALRFTKRSLNQWLRLGGVAAFDYSAALEIMGFFASDPGEGARAIAERRPPRFPSARQT